MKGISQEEAVALCAKVREQNRATLSSPTRMLCWQCQQDSGGDVLETYMTRKPGFLGCDLVNKLRARSERARSPRIE